MSRYFDKLTEIRFFCNFNSRENLPTDENKSSAYNKRIEKVYIIFIYILLRDFVNKFITIIVNVFLRI